MEKAAADLEHRADAAKKKVKEYQTKEAALLNATATASAKSLPSTHCEGVWGCRCEAAARKKGGSRSEGPGDR